MSVCLEKYDPWFTRLSLIPEPDHGFLDGPRGISGSSESGSEFSDAPSYTGESRMPPYVCDLNTLKDIFNYGVGSGA